MKFSQGLGNLLSSAAASSGGFDSEQKAKYKEMLLQPKDGEKYLVRILVEHDQLDGFSEHNYVAGNYVKKSGELMPGFATFQCTEDPDCPICNTYVVNKEGVKSKLKSRKVLALPIYLKEIRTVNRRNNSEKIEKIGTEKIIIIPPGRNNSNWQTLFDRAQISKTIQDRYFLISRTGTGLATVWSITPLDPEPFAEASDVVEFDTMEVIKGCGRWQDPLNNNFQINKGEENMTPTQQDMNEAHNDLADDL